jgi:hypothetical protein
LKNTKALGCVEIEVAVVVEVVVDVTVLGVAVDVTVLVLAGSVVVEVEVTVLGGSVEVEIEVTVLAGSVVVEVEVTVLGGSVSVDVVDVVVVDVVEGFATYAMAAPTTRPASISSLTRLRCQIVGDVKMEPLRPEVFSDPLPELLE